MHTADFSYFLPEAAIAQTPVEPRDAARLLDCRTWSDHTFSELPGLLAPGDLLVVNRTRVRAARLHGFKQDGGGGVEVLLLRDRVDGTWEVLIKPGRRIRSGTVLRLDDLVAEVVEDLSEGVFVVRLASRDGSDIERAIARRGKTPLPPYVRRPLDDPDRYQTIFADRVGSAAAPTAGLHFTERVVDSCEQMGIGVVPVELEVGLDTFRPIGTERVDDHAMHAERYRVPEDSAGAVNAVRAAGGRVVAIGTTVVRTLESAFDGEGVVAGHGSTDLFVRPGYRFGVVDLLVTNFHVPASTLVVMIAAFMGPAWRSCYARALARGYRFLSFGDAMLVERAA